MNPPAALPLDEPPDPGPRASDGAGSLPAMPTCDEDSRPGEGLPVPELIPGVIPSGVNDDGVNVELGLDELRVLGVVRFGEPKPGVVVSSVDGVLLDNDGSGNGIELDGFDGSVVEESSDGTAFCVDGSVDVSAPGMLGVAPPGVSAPGVEPGVPPGVSPPGRWELGLCEPGEPGS